MPAIPFFVRGRRVQSGNLQPVINYSDNDTQTYIQFGDSPSVDAFGRTRIAEPANRFDIEFIYNKLPDIIDEVTNGAGTATHNTNSRDVVLAVNAATANDEAALYGYDVPYTPGNSQLVNLTGTLDGAAIDNGEAFVFLRSTVTGSTVDDAIAQADWNNPVLDVDWTKSQIFEMDFQSLKVGRIRFYLLRNGLTVQIHEINNDNIRNTGFWQLPSLPPFWRIYNDATYTYMEIGYGDELNAIGFRYRIPVNANATMRAICGTVKSEGGFSLFDLPGFQRAADTGVTAKTVSTTLIPIVSIRPAATFNSLANRGLYIPTGYSVQANQDIRFALIYRPTLTDPVWTAVANSGMEYDVSATAISGGTIESSDYVTSAVGAASAGRATGILGRTLLKLGRTGTSDILSLAAIRTSNTDADVLSSLGWKEIR